VARELFGWHLAPTDPDPRGRPRRLFDAVQDADNAGHFAYAEQQLRFSRLLRQLRGHRGPRPRPESDRMNYM